MREGQGRHHSDEEWKSDGILRKRLNLLANTFSFSFKTDGGGGAVHRSWPGPGPRPRGRHGQPRQPRAGIARGSSSSSSSKREAARAMSVLLTCCSQAVTLVLSSTPWRAWSSRGGPPRQTLPSQSTLNIISTTGWRGACLATDPVANRNYGQVLVFPRVQTTGFGGPDGRAYRRGRRLSDNGRPAKP